MLTYWFTANLFSLSQYLVLNKVPGLKQAFNIPEAINHPADPQKPQAPGFWESVKSQYNAGLKVAEEERALKAKIEKMQKRQQLAKQERKE